ncbi:MAG TPA: hypothetical protein VIJ14_07835, partial [Rhabdochlamydiaceae bacterium]
DAPVVAKVFGIWNSRKGAFTAMGALLGASVAATYLYVELLFKAVIWGGEACANHPIRALVITAVFIGMFVLGASQDNGDRSHRGRRS